MGAIYKRRYRRRDGTIAESAVWWIKYYRNGIPMRESSESDKHGVAKDLLQKREGAVANGQRVNTRSNRVTFDDLAADVVTDYRVNGKRSIDDLERRIDLHLKDYFSGWRAVNIGTDDVRRYILKRQSEGAANATINRELATLKRAFTLGVDGEKLTNRPKIPMLREDNVRTGFFERQQFAAVRAALAEPLQGLVSFAYLTGWRIRSEVLRLQWRQVDFEAGTVRLDAGTTKNGEGRVFPFTRELRALLEAQRDYTRQAEREHGIICPWVFHRDGKPISVFRKAWANACKKAGCPARIPHDFRRTAVRNLVRAGIPERVAMTMTGHKTRSVFERYNIVSEGDLLDAARRLDDAAKKLTGTVRAQSAEKDPSLDEPAAVSY